SFGLPSSDFLLDFSALASKPLTRTAEQIRVVDIRFVHGWREHPFPGLFAYLGDELTFGQASQNFGESPSAVERTRGMLCVGARKTEEDMIADGKHGRTNLGWILVEILIRASDAD